MLTNTDNNMVAITEIWIKLLKSDIESPDILFGAMVFGVRWFAPCLMIRRDLKLYYLIFFSRQYFMSYYQPAWGDGPYIFRVWESDPSVVYITINPKLFFTSLQYRMQLLGNVLLHFMFWSVPRTILWCMRLPDCLVWFAYKIYSSNREEE